MPKVVVNDEKLISIADAMRKKAPQIKEGFGKEKLTLDEMATFGVDEVYASGDMAGYQAGYIAGNDIGEEYGYTNGYNDGYDEGYEEGGAEAYQQGYKIGQEQGQQTGYAQADKMHVNGNYGDYRISDGTAHIRLQMFAYANVLTKLTIPSSVKSAENGILQNNRGVKEVIFEDGGTITLWGENMFYGATALERVYFGNTFTVPDIFPNNTFYNCTKLQEIIMTQPEISGNLYMQNTSILKKQCVYDIIRKLKNQVGTDKEGAYTFKLHANVWAKADDTTAEDYQAPPQGNSWQEYVFSLGYLT